MNQNYVDPANNQLKQILKASSALSHQNQNHFNQISKSMQYNKMQSADY
jgi:hypothetical protein